MLSQRSLGTSGLMFESLNHFELILVNHVIQGFNFILHVVIQYFQNCSLKRLSFPLSSSLDLSSLPMIYGSISMPAPYCFVV